MATGSWTVLFHPEFDAEFQELEFLAALKTAGVEEKEERSRYGKKP